MLFLARPSIRSLGQVRRMLWRWPRPAPTTSPPSKLDVQDASGDGSQVHGERGQNGTEEEIRQPNFATDEQRGNKETAAGRNECDAGGDGDHARYMSWQYRFCCGKARERCEKLVHHHFFEAGIMALIFASSVTLIIQSPLDDPSKTKAKVLSGVDLSMTLLFSCEMLLKVSESVGLRMPTTHKVSPYIHGCEARGVSKAIIHSQHDDGRYRLFVVARRAGWYTHVHLGLIDHPRGLCPLLCILKITNCCGESAKTTCTFPRRPQTLRRHTGV